MPQKLNRDEKDPQFRLGMQKNSFLRWNIEENIIYAKFLQRLLDNASQLEKKLGQVKVKGYVNMAKIVKTKNNHQCRSHHIKMLKTHGNIQNIIFHFINNGGKNQVFIEKSEIKSIKNEEENNSFCLNEAQTIEKDQKNHQSMQFQQIVSAINEDREETFFSPFHPPQFFFSH